MIKLIVSDCDGTIVPEATFDINKEYEEVIEKLIDKGMIFALASGRQYHSMAKLMPRIYKKIYFLADNAASIVYNDELLSSLYLDEEIVKEMIEYVRYHRKIRLVLSRMDGYYIESNDTYLHHKVFNNLEGLGEIVPDLYKYIKGTTKVSILAKADLYEIAEDLISRWGDKLHIAISGSEWIDITDSKATKGFGVKFLQNKFNITKEETLGLGNSYNDIELLKNSGIALVPEDSHDDIKTYATSIIKSVFDDGALNEFKKFL